MNYKNYPQHFAYFIVAQAVCQLRLFVLPLVVRGQRSTRNPQRNMQFFVSGYLKKKHKQLL